MDFIHTDQLLAAVSDEFDQDPVEQVEVVEDVLLEIEVEKEVEPLLLSEAENVMIYSEETSHDSDDCIVLQSLPFARSRVIA